MTDPLFDLKDKIVVVTGGMGQLGTVYAEGLIARGVRVAMLDTRVDDSAVAKCFGEDSLGTTILPIACDVTDRASLEAALAAIEAAWGTPVGLVNNAAIDAPPGASPAENGPFELFPEASWKKVMEVNVTGTFLACQVFGGAMAAGSGGSVINVGSQYGLVSPDQSLYDHLGTPDKPFIKPVAYSASKSALHGLTTYLAAYWAKRSVRVNTAIFGGVLNDQDETFRKKYCTRVPMGRMAHAEEYVGVIVFMLSNASSFMTGSEVVVDGGWTAI